MNKKRNVSELDKLKKLSELQAKFVSTVSHELRTPLSIIVGTVDNMIDGLAGKFTASQRKCIQTIRNNALRLHSLINSLLDISSLDSEKMVFKRRAVDISGFIRKTIKSLQPLAREKEIEMTYESPKFLPMVYADSERISQVLTNLLSNAIKFTPSKGKINVKATAEKKEVGASVEEESRGLFFSEHGFIPARTSVTPDFVHVTVSDTGIGIKPQELEKIFDRFYQIEGGVEAGLRGAGLGLAISKEIIQRHKGKIWVESKYPDGGSKFHFTLLQYTPSLNFYISLDERFQLDKKEGKSLSLIFIETSEEGNGKIFSRVEKIVQDNVRGLDVVTKYQDKIAVICDTAREGALIMEKRFKDAIQKHKVNKDSGSKMSVNFGIATYPEDTATEEGLIRKSLERLKEIK
ncbi:ATP-binding protein [bacterium]|nr:ATP-binding protein [bacterium]